MPRDPLRSLCPMVLWFIGVNSFYADWKKHFYCSFVGLGFFKLSWKLRLVWKLLMIMSEIIINPSLWMCSLPEKHSLVQKGQWKKGSEKEEQLYRFPSAVSLEALPQLSGLRCGARGGGHQQAGTRQPCSSVCPRVRLAPGGRAAEGICCLLHNLLSKFTYSFPCLVRMSYFVRLAPAL